MKKEINMVLEIGMKKAKVLRLANRLAPVQKQKVENFFQHDRDGKISHENDLAILNSFFDGTNKVKMPIPVTGKGLILDNASCCHHLNKDGTITWDTLSDYDNDGYADKHVMGENQPRIKVPGSNIRSFVDGWIGIDTNIDGVPEKKGMHRMGSIGDAIDVDNSYEPEFLKEYW